MEESEKMVALKKAYADIILNTAKEAAARIMVSERKVMRFEKDLGGTKDEALRLLVRLKQMIDSTTKEAEVTSLTKQRKIGELEAQLNEAEDVITDLRSELRWVRDKLEKVRNNQLQPLNGKIKKEDSYIHGDMTVGTIIPSVLSPQLEDVTTSDMENNPSNLRISDNSCPSTTQPTENFSVTPDLASTIMKSKEPELYMNACSQRIHALERNLLSAKLPPLGDKDGLTLVKNELITETNDKFVGNSTAPSAKTKLVEITRKSSGREVRKLVKVRTSRRKKTRFGKAKTVVRKSRPGYPKKRCHLSLLPSHCKSYLVNGNVRSEESIHTLPSLKAVNVDNVKNCSDLDEKLLHKSSFNEEIKITQKGKENMRVLSRDAAATSFVSPPDHLIEPSQPSSAGNRGVIYSFAIRGNVKSGEDGTKTAENEAKMKPLPRLDPGLTLIRSGVNPVSGSTNVTVSVKMLNKSRLLQKAEENVKELRDESALVKPGGDVLENSMLLCPELSHEVINEPVLTDLEDAKSSVETDRSPSKPDCNRVLKYTFQRKRKKESMSNPGENTSPDKTILKRRAAEKQNDAQEPGKSTLINESSRDSRRVAQVARQLISLSGRRW